MPDHKRTYPKIQVTLTDDTLAMVDAHAKRIGKEDEPKSFNRSLAIRELIRIADMSLSKPRKKSRSGT